MQRPRALAIEPQPASFLWNRKMKETPQLVCSAGRSLHGRFGSDPASHGGARGTSLHQALLEMRQKWLDASKGEIAITLHTDA